MNKVGQEWWTREYLGQPEDMQRRALRNLLGEVLNAKSNPAQEVHAAFKAARLTPLNALEQVPVTEILERISAAVNACPEHCIDDLAGEEDNVDGESVIVYMVSCGHMCHECERKDLGFGQPFEPGRGHAGRCVWGRLNKYFRSVFVPGKDGC